MVADHPITPSAELLQQLDEELANYHGPPTKASEIGMDEKSLNIVRKALETIEDE
jgi:hypothetical protein